MTTTTTKITNEGLGFLGCPVGTLAYQKDENKKSATKFAAVLSLVRNLEAQIAFPIIQSCVNTRPTFMARTSPPPASDLALQDFDDEVDQALLHICGSTASDMPPISASIRGLPYASGGLGLRRLQPINSLAWTASFTHMFQMLAKFHSPLAKDFKDFQRCSYRALQPFLEIVQKAAPMYVIEEEGSGALGLRNWTAPKNAKLPPFKQKDLCAVFDSESLATLQEMLPREDSFGAAWFLSNSYKGSGQIFTPHTWQPSLMLSHEAFSVNLSLRLLLPSRQIYSGRGSGQLLLQQCESCRDDEDLDRMDPRFHGLSCKQLQQIRLDRHDLIRNTLAAFLGKVFLSSNVEMEVTVEEETTGAMALDKRRFDIAVTTAKGRYFIDVSVVNPACVKYLRVGSDHTKEAAADNMDCRKRAKYGPTLDALRLQPSAFVPFVLETSGRLNSSAQQFLQSMSSMVGDSRHLPNFAESLQLLLRRLRLTVARGNKLLTEAFHRHSRVLVVPPAGYSDDG
jgi:hypothetical protein